MTSQLPLVIQNLSCSIGNTVIFKNASLKLERREFVSMMGENGIGKTCLLEIICGLRKQKSGDVFFWGKSITAYDTLDLFSKVAFVTSTPESYPFRCKISELLKFTKSIYPHWNDKLALQLCDDFKISDSKCLADLSLGEQSKIRLIKAISFEPELLLLDELTANLSPDSKTAVLKTLMDVFSKGKMSIVYVCHAKEEAIRLSDRVLELTTEGLSEKVSL